MLSSLTPNARRAFLKSLSAAEEEFLRTYWPLWARPEQRPPPGDWRTWLFLGGRGAGKTRAGSEWVRGEVEGATPLGRGRRRRIALVGQGHGDVREVMIEGPSGVRAVAPRDWRPVFEASRRRLVWPNGAVAYGFSAEDPDGLRGPQFDAAWCDETAAWRAPETALAMLDFALRLGERPQRLITTTPRPIPALRALLAAEAVAVTRAATKANAAFLSAAFLAAVEQAYAGTRLARQELDGEMVEDAEGALWTRALLAQAYDPRPPALDRIVVGVDPPASIGPNADACGVIVAGRAGDGSEAVAWVLADRSVQGLTPEGWARRVADAASAFEADRVVAEINQGGAMVGALMDMVAPGLPVRGVRAAVGKAARAEPIAALYERGRVRHAGRFPALEDEMCAFGAPGGGGSPDRVDALVWALAELLLGGEGRPRLRTME